MSKIPSFRAVLLGTLFLAVQAPAGPASPGVWPGIRRVVILGDSITYGGDYVVAMEAWLMTRQPGRRIEILNLGLPSETVSGLSEPGHAGGQFPRPDLHERLDRVLEKTKPDLVVACYGMNDGIYLPLAEDRFQKYQAGIQKLREHAAAVGARLLLVTPPVFDEVKGGHPGYGGVLDRYSEWLLSRREKGWDVVDAHGPMRDDLAERRGREPGYFLAGDGVHPGAAGHWLIAKPILEHIGAADLAGVEGPEAMLAGYPNGENLLKIIGQKQRLQRDAWLTETRHLRPGIATGLPLAEAQAQAEALDNQIRELVAESGRK